MREAGIRVWVLTGDKVGTAIMVGFACRLLTETMRQVQVEAHDSDGNLYTGKHILRQLDAIRGHNESDMGESAFSSLDTPVTPGLATPTSREGRTLRDASTSIMSTMSTVTSVVGEQEAVSVVIDGHALLALGIGLDADTKRKLTDSQRNKMREQQRSFVEKCTAATAVVCCRVSPAQKADITKLMKMHGNAITLAIGDGANDVGMITEAHIGVGIYGVEGGQAVNNSDFAIAQFRDLARLLLVHGRWTYKRLAQVICYFFYKNMVVSFTIVLYTASSGFSGNALYDDMALAAYNVAFTSFPVIVLGLFEQDTDAETSLKYPPLYTNGPLDVWLNGSRFFWWVCEGVYAAFVVYAISWRASQHDEEPSNLSSFSGSGIFEDGLVLEQAGVGVLLYTVVIFVVTLRVALETQYWTWLHHTTFWGSVFLWFLFCFVEGAAPGGIVSNGTIYFIIYSLVPRPFYWLATLLGTVIALIPAFCRKAYVQCYKPRINDKIRTEILAKQQDDRRRSARRSRKRAAQGLPSEPSNPEVRSQWPQLGFAESGDEPNPIEVIRGRTTLTGRTPRSVGMFHSFTDSDFVCQVTPGLIGENHDMAARYRLQRAKTG